MQTDDHHKGPPVPDFGWWPEIVGAALTLGVIAFLITQATGSL